MGVGSLIKDVWAPVCAGGGGEVFASEMGGSGGGGSKDGFIFAGPANREGER